MAQKFSPQGLEDTLQSELDDFFRTVLYTAQFHPLGRIFVMFVVRRAPATAIRAARFTSTLAGRTLKYQPVSVVAGRWPRPVIARFFHLSTRRLQNAAPRRAVDDIESEGASAVNIVNFQQLGEERLVGQPFIDRITQDMGIMKMTDVQRLTIPASLQGIDV